MGYEMWDKRNTIILILILVIIVFGFLWGRSYRDNRQYRESIEQLRNELITYKSINKQLSEQNKRFAKSITELRKQLSEYRKRIAEARKIVAGLQRDTGTISGELQQAIKTVRRIKAELQNLKKSLQSNDDRK